MDRLIAALTVKVSAFFRDPVVFEVLHSFVLPELSSEFGYLHAWSLGCAAGDEPYSLAILMHDLLTRDRQNIDLRVAGTDLCDGAIEKALRGLYPAEELTEVKKRFLDTYFERVQGTPAEDGGPESVGEGGIVTQHRQRNPAYTPEDRYRVRNEIKALVKFDCGDVLTKLERQKSRSSFNVIFCRNLLIYMNRALQDEILRSITAVLSPKGCLVIGQSETISEGFRGVFRQPFPGLKLFRKLSSDATDHAIAQS
jgi:chemotaxis protein methyltransferase CheR